MGGETSKQWKFGIPRADLEPSIEGCCYSVIRIFRLVHVHNCSLFTNLDYMQSDSIDRGCGI